MRACHKSLMAMVVCQPGFGKNLIPSVIMVTGVVMLAEVIAIVVIEKFS